MMLECRPRAVTQGGRGDEQGALPLVFNRLPDDLAADESLSEPDTIGNQHAVILLQDSLGAKDAVVLKSCGRDECFVLSLGFQFVLVTLPEHAQINQVRVIGFVSSFVN